MADNKGVVKVRKMKKTDLAKVNAVDNSLFGKRRVTTWPFTFDMYWRIYEPDLCFVAEIGQDVVGFVGGVIESEERSKLLISQPRTMEIPGMSSPKIGWIEMMGVHGEHWGKGIGQALMDAFVAECKKQQAAVRIVIRDDDENLKSFLSGQGFKKSDFVSYELKTS
jgi:ribosomal protein S18 acetylase RimI-like enzyme